MSEVSAFWQELNQKNEQQLRSSGIENIKRTVALNYFTWVGTLSWRDDQFRHLVRKTRLADWPKILRDRPPAELPGRQWFYLCTFTRMLHLFAKRHDPVGLLDRLAEPSFGNPFRITLEGKIISQDLANSVLELYSMLDEIDFDAPLNICEIGAGYGRNAFVFLSLLPNCSYTIIDVPPAIDVARKYLKTVCPSSNVRFLLPDQLPSSLFDLTINISSFHEMPPAQVEEYFAFIDATSKKLYLKQWKCWHNPSDDVTITESDYPYRPNWRRIYSRTTMAQPSFFEALYEI